MNKILSLMAIVAVLAGCTFIDNILSPSPNVIATLESTLATADDAEVTYLKLPSCFQVPQPSLCRNLPTVKTLQKLRIAAYTAVTKFEANETSSLLQAAQNAVSAYSAVAQSVSQ